MTCWVGSSGSSQHPAKFIDLVTCENQDKIFLICNVTAQLKYHVTCEWGSLILSHHLVKFGVNSHCGIGGIIFFISHVTAIPEYHVTLLMDSIGLVKVDI